jgi:cysteine synthase
MSIPTVGTFTDTLTNETLTLTESMAVRAISIVCTSTTAGTITGTAKLLGRVSTALSIDQNETVTYVSQTAGVISGLVITAPSGCTLEVIAQV